VLGSNDGFRRLPPGGPWSTRSGRYAQGLLALLANRLLSGAGQSQLSASRVYSVVTPIRAAPVPVPPGTRPALIDRKWCASEQASQCRPSVPPRSRMPLEPNQGGLTASPGARAGPRSTPTLLPIRGAASEAVARGLLLPRRDPGVGPLQGHALAHEPVPGGCSARVVDAVGIGTARHGSTVARSP
jgi:hypothetical protein